MTPAQLRVWIHKYGNLGILIAAGYLGLRCLRARSHRVFAASLCVLALTALLVSALHLRTRRSHHVRLSMSTPIPIESLPVASSTTPEQTPHPPPIDPSDDLLAKATRIADTTDWDLHIICGIQSYQDYFWASPEKVFFFKRDEEISRLLCEHNLQTGKERAFRKVSRMWDDDGFYKQRIEISPDGQWVLWSGDFHPEDYSYHGTYYARLDGSQKFHVADKKGEFIGWRWLPDSRHLLETTGKEDEQTGEYTLSKAVIRTIDGLRITRALSRRQAKVYLDNRLVTMVSNHRVIFEDYIHAGADLAQHVLEEIEADPEPKRLHRWTITPPKTSEREEMQISPNGRRLAWILFQPTASQDFHKATLCTSSMDGSHMREIGHLRVPPLGSMGEISDFDQYPHRLKWLPDGKQLSFLYKDTLYTLPID
ncbi:MAG TPA: hypothetical protein VKU00_27715 [Chthonomonadaceae bacterium]|nr:hypothetical protein [Chthonomonadaceae bacterium]